MNWMPVRLVVGADNYLHTNLLEGSLSTITVTDASFRLDVLNSATPVLVDFWAAWCGPCRMVAPILEELSEEFADVLTVAKLDVDENPGTAATYGITSIPTLLLFKDGEVVKTILGAKPKAALLADLAPVL